MQIQITISESDAPECIELANRIFQAIGDWQRETIPDAAVTARTAPFTFSATIKNPPPEGSAPQ